MEGFSLKKHR